MDSTSPAPASIVGSTNAFAAVSAFEAFTLELVERLPLPPHGWLSGADGTGGSDYTSTAPRSRPA